MKEKNKDLLLTLQKSIRILDTFSEECGVQSINEIMEKTGYPKSVVYRILQTLVYEGWMIQDSYSKRYSLGYGLLGYEQLVFLDNSLIEVCDPFMKVLKETFNETITLVIKDNDNGRCIHKIESEHHIQLISKLGKTIPLYAGATGKCILAFQSDQYLNTYLLDRELIKFTEYTVNDTEILRVELEKIKLQGFATTTSETDLDTFTVAIPIFGKDNYAIGSLGISCPTYRHNSILEKRMIESAIETRDKINLKLSIVD